MKKVIIVDDHPVICMAVSFLLSREGYQVVGETDNGLDALTLTRQLKPDLVILDIGIPRLDGLEVVMRLNRLDDIPKVLILTSQPPETFASRCMQAGAAGYVSKSENLSELLNALTAIKSGYTFFPRLAVNSVNPRDHQSTEQELIDSLSDRELTVLRKLASGFSNKEIGDEMLLSNKTISTYKTRIIEKLQVRTLVDLIDIAKRHSLV